MGDRDDPDDVMETSLTIDYDKQWLNYVSAIGPYVLYAVKGMVGRYAYFCDGRHVYSYFNKRFR